MPFFCRSSEVLGAAVQPAARQSRQVMSVSRMADPMIATAASDSTGVVVGGRYDFVGFPA